MVSIGIHIYARPFEDAGTNWVEMLTLTSQLFLLVAGPVFKTLNNPDNGMDGGVAASFRQGLELVSAGTLIAALSLSTLTQVNVWREVRTTGEDHEHDDYKVRTEEKHIEAMAKQLEHRREVVAKLKEAHALLEAERIEAFSTADEPRSAFQNPLGDGDGGGDVNEGADEDSNGLSKT